MNIARLAFSLLGVYVLVIQLSFHRQRQVKKYSTQIIEKRLERPNG